MNSKEFKEYVGNTEKKNQIEDALDRLEDIIDEMYASSLDVPTESYDQAEDTIEEIRGLLE